VMSAILRHRAAEVMARVEAGQPGVCLHLRGMVTPRPVTLLAYGPPRFICGDCLEDEWDAIRGTPEDARCDGCGRIADGISTVVALLDGEVYDVPGRPVFACPPTFFWAGLCDDCRAIEESAP
jgi:hypothetical protein